MALLVIATTGYAQTADTTDADTTDIAKAITAKEKEVYETIKAGDMKAFEAYLTNDFVGVSPSGIMDKAKEVENISGLKLDSYELTDVQVIQAAEGVALIFYTVNASGMYQNKKFSGKFYATSTWVEKDGEWKAAMHTETEAAPTQGQVGMKEGNK